MVFPKEHDLFTLFLCGIFFLVRLTRKGGVFETSIKEKVA